ncbi:MAG: hypothetical protein NTW49_06055, partial [Bacteroidia bacterium]|nr:hypothetical protein [Bacteroidia bacterium]
LTILFFIFIFINEIIWAQTPAKKDSTILYKNIESYSKRSKFTKFMYKLVFKPLAPHSKKKKSKKKIYKKLIKKPYSAFEGKIIRNIDIVTLDPFGYSTTDTAVVEQNLLFKTGNELHVKTQRITIMNLILIRRNQPFDSLIVRESERLIRSQKYVHDVTFFVVPTGRKKTDSVDIYIRVSDTWSIIPGAAISGSYVSIGLTDKNFLGTGHEFKNSFTRNYSNGNSFDTQYSIPNIRNTYVSSILHYGINGNRYFNKNLTVDRPFFSPLARWAAGVSFMQQFRRDSLHISDQQLVLQNIKFNAQDYWAGVAIQIFKGNTENDRTTNFITALRFLRINYLERPDKMIDTLHNYSDENLYLAGFGISTRKYVQDKFIFNYGVIEDVPIGKVYSLTVGYQENNNIGRQYIGTRVSSGFYYPWGYLSSDWEYGTYIRKSHVEQGVFSAGIIYFTGLEELGRWKFRQFVKPQFIFGINRFSYDSLTLKGGNGLDGFNSSALSGTSRFLLTLQTQSYAPWNLFGFRFGPYLLYSLGMLGHEGAGFTNSKVYSQIGFGVLIKNEYLLISTFQISIAFYPVIPGNGTDIFKINSFRTTDFGFRDFVIGKPAPVTYQ